MPGPRLRRVPASAHRTITATLTLLALVGLALAACSTPPGNHRMTGAFTVQVSVSACGSGWSAHTAGPLHLTFHNTDSRAGGVQLIGLRSGAVYAEVEPLGPGTTDELDIVLGAGTYSVRCLMEDEAAVAGPAVTLTGTTAGAAPAVVPVRSSDLITATAAYQRYVTGQLPVLVRATSRLARDLSSGDVVAARRDWRAAHLVYASLGAAYGAFGDAGDAIDGRADGRPAGVHDPSWTGFHRIEYGLWHGQSAAVLAPLAARLLSTEQGLQRTFAHAEIDPAELTLRAHEITEDALEFELTDRTDYGSHTTLATVGADLAGTVTVLGVLHSLLVPRDPQLPALTALLARTRTAVAAVSGSALSALPPAARERVDADVSELCELLALRGHGARTPEDLVSGTGRGVDRRGFLRGAALAAGGAAAGSVGARGLAPHPAAAAPAAAAAPVAFHGPHQAGVTSDRQTRSTFVAFDVTATDRGELTDLLRTITDRARFLAAGGTPPALGISAPPSDSGVLGPVVPDGGFNLVAAVGSSLFDDRFGLGARRPRRLRPMDTFVNDDLDPARCHGDLLLQLAGDADDVVLHALRDIARHTRGAMVPRWRVDGFVSAPRPSGTPRNLLGFRDGTANPTPAEYDRLVWVRPGAGEPAWAAGGTYQVVRIIRMLVEFWDRVALTEQERMIGRRRASGAPLSGSLETDTPDYADDPTGTTTPLDAHIRLANPRTPATDASRILRRGHNYDAGIDANGNLDMGLVFNCFQQDLDRQFVDRAEAAGRRAARRLHRPGRRRLLLRPARRRATPATSSAAPCSPEPPSGSRSLSAR